jgi:hypothetical protein
MASCQSLVLYCLMTTACFYLGSQAVITKWAWSHYPRWLDKFMSCSACSGFWYGLLAAFVLGWGFDLPFLGLDGRHWATPIVVGLGSIVWTPILAYYQILALTQLGPQQEVPIVKQPAATPKSEPELATAPKSEPELVPVNPQMDLEKKEERL